MAPESPLRDHLLAQNPWWLDPASRGAPTRLVRRGEFAGIRERFLDAGGPQVLLVGPRQVGKTTLLRQVADSLLDDGIAPERVVCFNFQDERLATPAPQVGDVVEAHARAFPGVTRAPRLFLFDEIGQAPRWDVGLKQVHESGTGRVLATDSAALLLAGRRTIAGRYFEQRISFLSQPDFALFRRGLLGATAAEELAASQVLDAYLQRGGFPAHVIVADASVAYEATRQAVETALLLDLTTAASLRQPEQARALFAALAADSGTVFNATQRGEKDLGVPRQTADRWLDILVGTGLLAKLPRWTRSARARGREMPKVYASDPGIVAAFSLSPSPIENDAARGRIVETAAHSHLRLAAGRLGARLTYAETAGEADFVLEGDGGAVVLQVTAGRASNPRDASSAWAVARDIPRSVAAVSSRHPLEHVHEVEGGRVKEVPLWSLFERLVAAQDFAEVIAWLRP